MPLLATGLTDIGQKRKSNQDSIFLSLENKLFLVADGMGGHNGGDIASQLAVKVIPEHIHQETSSSPDDEFKESYRRANLAILNKAKMNTELMGMGTTAVGFYFKGHHLNIANVGDSRAYLISKGAIFQLTRDHSVVEEKFRLGLYTREEALADPQKNVLSRAIGVDEDLEIDLFTYKVCKNDLFLLCSDGLHGKVSTGEMLNIISQHLPKLSLASNEALKKAASDLVALANKHGGQDNISVILVLAQSA